MSKQDLSMERTYIVEDLMLVSVAAVASLLLACAGSKLCCVAQMEQLQVPSKYQLME
jgi:hypothetical protein